MRPSSLKPNEVRSFNYPKNYDRQISHNRMHDNPTQESLLFKHNYLNQYTQDKEILLRRDDHKLNIILSQNSPIKKDLTNSSEKYLNLMPQRMLSLEPRQEKANYSPETNKKLMPYNIKPNQPAHDQDQDMLSGLVKRNKELNEQNKSLVQDHINNKHKYEIDIRNYTTRLKELEDDNKKVKLINSDLQDIIRKKDQESYHSEQYYKEIHNDSGKVLKRVNELEKTKEINEAELQDKDRKIKGLENQLKKNKELIENYKEVLFGFLQSAKTGDKLVVEVARKKRKGEKPT